MYRKFTADHIFTGQQLLPGNYVLITNTQGLVIDIIDEKMAGDNIERFNGLLTPGFVNSHCHLELSHLKGVIPVNSGLVNFVLQVMNKRTANEELKLEAMDAAEQEMYANGIAAVGDICNTADSISTKQKSLLKWHNFIEVSGFVAATADKRMGEMKNILELFQIANSTLQPSNKQLVTFAPHAPYSVSKKLFGLLNNETSGQVITIHNQESAAENELYQNKTGDILTLYEKLGIDISNFQPTGHSSIKTWFRYFTNNQSIISVHNTFTDQEDISFIKQQITNDKLFFCLCPNANKYIENSMPPFDLLQKNNVDIIIGTDSYASNFQLNVLEEIKTILQESGTVIPIAEILKWATINGAKALQMDDRLGSFEKGKSPGIVLIDKMNGEELTVNSTSKRIL